MSEQTQRALDAFDQVQVLLEELTNPPPSSFGNEKLLEHETASRILNQYPQNDKITSLHHWLDSIYISEEGKTFLRRIIYLASKKDSPEETLMDIEIYLRFTVIGAIKSSTSHQLTLISGPATLSTLELTVDELAQAAGPKKRIPGFSLLLGLRDNGRCQLTRLVSRNLIEESERLVRSDPYEFNYVSKIMCFTEAAQIISVKGAADDSSSGDCDDPAELLYWQSLYHLFPEIQNKINANSINDFSNAFTLQSSLHIGFRKFDFGLNPMGDNKYEVIVLTPYPMSEFDAIPKTPDGRMVVEFSYSGGPNDKDKVCDDLLRVHLAVASIFHLVGGLRMQDEDFCLDEGALRAAGGSLTGTDKTSTDTGDSFAWSLVQRLKNLVV